ncbi:MAG: hypothetical protein KIT84_02415 [Labilithrix sp.]|nr:hypothetical protein [Labilithrix sp.]MCW5809839.1 hypothetical protein [Labilithrix sp.]
MSVLLLVAAVACGEDDPGAATPAPAPACGDGRLDPGEECEGFDLRGATCDALGLAVGTLACNAECKLDTTGCGGKCGDGVVQPGEDCDGANLNGKTCALVSPTAIGALGCSADCHFLIEGCSEPVPAGELAPCTPGAANDCAAPATCVTTARGSFCLEACDLASTAGPCGAGRYCEDVGGAGACANVPATGAGCTARSGCAGAGDTCIPTFTSATGAPISTCAPSCPATEVGKGQGSCAAGLSCVAIADGPAEIESPTACTAATESTDCTVANGYRCNPVPSPAGEVMRCTRPYGQCAPVTPLYKFDGSAVPDTLLCDRARPTRGAGKCGLASAAPLANPARVDCVEHFAGTPEIGVCTAFCDSAVMDAPAAGGPAPEGSCGDGAICKAPAAPELWLAENEPRAIACTEADLAGCGADFKRCVDLGRGPECVRAVKVCVPN